MGWSRLRGRAVTLRFAEPADVPALVRIRETPEVHSRWRGEDLTAEIGAAIADPDLGFYVIEHNARVAGAIQWSVENDPDYHHASIDIYVDPALHGQGVGTDAVRTLATHLIDDENIHRLVIDPAADNAPAIRCYEKVGFRPVGIMRQYERDATGWHDGLLMDLLAADLIRDR
ncbi:GNAT family N-acetyltransferase [Actinoplanes sp. NPDC049265]|uniref:GNAT family N-acetyltransferase n=1 Tax=Actinoplanes sp. NPDC049265 TaxID=3363902 RepID=UPI0037142358